MDVTSAAQRGRVAAFLLEHPLLGHEKGGAPDLWVNNAGVCIRQVEEDDDGDGGDDNDGDTNARRAAYEESHAVNTWGPVRLLTEACLPRMRRRGYVGLYVFIVIYSGIGRDCLLNRMGTINPSLFLQVRLRDQRLERGRGAGVPAQRGGQAPPGHALPRGKHSINERHVSCHDHKRI